MSRFMLVMALLLLIVSAACAQPMLQTVETVDWMAADGHVVVRAIVVDFAQEVDADKKKWNTIVLKVRETLKGRHEPFHTYLAPEWDYQDVSRWKKTEQELLVFLVDTKAPNSNNWPWHEKAKIHARTLRNQLGVIELKDPVSHGKDLGPSGQVYTLDVQDPKEPQKLLQAVREAIAAAEKVKELRAHRLEWPLRFSTRIVPVNELLERHARRWISSDKQELRNKAPLR